MTYFIAAALFVGGLVAWTVWIWKLSEESAKRSDIVHTDRGRIETRRRRRQ